MDRPEKVTRTLAIQAQCHQCMGYYTDGKVDCKNIKCPLYKYMPHRKIKPDYEWLDYNPKKKGLVLWEDCGRDLTDEEREEIADRLRKTRVKSKGEKDERKKKKKKQRKKE